MSSSLLVDTGLGKPGSTCESATGCACLWSEQSARPEEEINKPLVDESATASASSAKPLFLDAFDLDDDSILDDHPDLAIPDAADGPPDAIQIDIHRGTRGESSFVVLRGLCNVWHAQLDTLAELPGSRDGESYQ